MDDSYTSQTVIRNQNLKSLGILWAQYGPYHLARVTALKKLAGPLKVHALELASQTSNYDWNRATAADLITLCPGAVAEKLSFWQVFLSARRSFAELKIEVCLLPSYAPKQPLAALLAAKSLGIRTVMMNESHAGTARVRGLGAWVKRRLVGLFDAALVGGQPQTRYFVSLGLPEEKIFAGYDAVDNDYFARRANEVRSTAPEFRKRFALPAHYFLSLGRFVAKKNLATMIRAYRQFLDESLSPQTHLVMVGSGAEEPALLSLCHELRLAVYDKKPDGIDHKSKSDTGHPGVHFYGFRQVEENPVFYALADVFILPSLYEEWGLVVNEAMACGLPVVVSETVGCVEDLLRMAPSESLPPSQSGPSPRLDHLIRKNGFVFDPRSSESLAGALKLLAAHPELRSRMGQASRSIVADFSCDVFARNALLAARAAKGETTPAALTAGDHPLFETTKPLL